jgi:hypothetical protein
MSSAMTPPDRTPGPDDPPPIRPLPLGTKIVAGILLLIPMVALAVVPSYSSETPKLWGFPFFYWYELMWVFLTAGLTYAAYLVITRARGEKR